MYKCRCGYVRSTTNSFAYLVAEKGKRTIMTTLVTLDRAASSASYGRPTGLGQSIVKRTKRASTSMEVETAQEKNVADLGGSLL